jgi:hypothetical protein
LYTWKTYSIGKQIKNKAQKQNKAKSINKNRKQNKNKNKIKKNEKKREKKRKIGIRYSRNYLVKLLHDEFSMIILIYSRYLILGILALYILVIFCSIICGERWFFVFHHIGRIV